MKRGLFILSTIFLFSCNGNDDILNTSSLEQSLENSTNSNLSTLKDKIGNNVELKKISDLVNPIKSESLNYSFAFTKQIDFGTNNKKTSILAGVDKEGKIYYSEQNDGVVDFFVEPVIKNDYSDVYYLDSDGNKIYRLKLTVNSNKTGVDIEFVESYNKMNSALTGRKWSQCFSAEAGSALGVSGAVVSGFTGPWGVAGWYAGIAAYCALT